MVFRACLENFESAFLKDPYLPLSSTPYEFQPNLIITVTNPQVLAATLFGGKFNER
jgi:hypothetical protein